MAITPAELLALGVALQSGRAEAEQRAGISRLYYGAFHRSKDWHSTLPAQGSLPAGQAGSHQVVVHQLRSPANACNVGTRRRSVVVGNRLDAMRILRKTADYQLGATITPQELANHLAQAQGIFADCDAPLP